MPANHHTDSRGSSLPPPPQDPPPTTQTQLERAPPPSQSGAGAAAGSGRRRAARHTADLGSSKSVRLVSADRSWAFSHKADPVSVEKGEGESGSAPSAAPGASATANMSGKMYALHTKWWKRASKLRSAVPTTSSMLASPSAMRRTCACARARVHVSHLRVHACWSVTARRCRASSSKIDMPGPEARTSDSIAERTHGSTRPSSISVYAWMSARPSAVGTN